MSITPSDLYAMAMESDTAGDFMSDICLALGIPYPPNVDDYTEIEIKPPFNFMKNLEPHTQVDRLIGNV